MRSKGGPLVRNATAGACRSNSAYYPDCGGVVCEPGIESGGRMCYPREKGEHRFHNLTFLTAKPVLAQLALERTGFPHYTLQGTTHTPSSRRDGVGTPQETNPCGTGRLFAEVIAVTRACFRCCEVTGLRSRDPAGTHSDRFEAGLLPWHGACRPPWATLPCEPGVFLLAAAVGKEWEVRGVWMAGESDGGQQ